MSEIPEEDMAGTEVHLSYIGLDLTPKQLTNQEPSPGGIGGPMNSFANIGAFPTADMRVVVRPRV